MPTGWLRGIGFNFKLVGFWLDFPHHTDKHMEADIYS